MQIKDWDIDYRIEVYDNLGRKQKIATSLNRDQQFDVSSLSVGSYFFTLVKGDELVYNGRFVKN